ncbi:MAG: hypothetical protein ACJ796_14255 [Gemmatimonadaceae bacterium]
MASEATLERCLDLVTHASAARIESLQPSASTHAKTIRKIFDSPNVVAVGIAEKISDNKPTGKLALTFYVERKVPLSKLRADRVIPPTMPESLSGPEAVPTDVVVLGKIRPEINATRQPIQAGNSIGHVRVTAGTLGAIVRKGKQIHLLSNSHVLADSGQGKKGDEILYPGSADGGSEPGDVVATLAAFKQFVKGGAFVNHVDCAIAKPTREREADVVAEIKGDGLPKGVVAPKRGMKVVKVGRTTNRTVGEVRDVHFRFVLDYGDNVGEVGYTDQVLCTRYTKGGDSGSLVMEQGSGRAVGLHFAGANGGSVFNPIGDVLDALGITLVTKALSAGQAAGKKRLRGAKKRVARRKQRSLRSASKKRGVKGRR